MIIHIDGVPDLISAQPEASTESILDSLGSVLLSGGRSLSGYELNGEKIEQDDLEKKLNEGLGAEEVLNLQTEPLGDALTSQLDEIAKALQSREEELLQIGEGLTKENPSESLENLSQCLLELKGMAEALGQLLKIFTIEDGEGKEISTALNGLSVAFQRLEVGFKNNEVVEMADFVEHDLPGILAKLRGVFPEIAVQIRKGLETA